MKELLENLEKLRLEFSKYTGKSIENQKIIVGSKMAKFLRDNITDIEIEEHIIEIEEHICEPD